MATAKDQVKNPGRTFNFVFMLFLVLMGLAHGWAWWLANQDQQRSAFIAYEAQKREQVAEKPPGMKYYEGYFHYYFVAYCIKFTIQAALILLIPALCFYLLRPSDTTWKYWVSFWTFAYLAYLVHFCWAAFGLFEGDFQEMLNSPPGANEDTRRVLAYPIPDLVLTVWWGIDVLLAWKFTKDNRLVRWQRGVLHALVFGAFFGATVLTHRESQITYVLGLVMAVAAAAVLLVRALGRLRAAPA
jgi:hypothetical protein